MKKLLSIVVAAMMATVSLNAQEDFSRHELGISYGGMSNSTWMTIGDALGTVIATIGSIRYDDGSFTGPIGLEYFYHSSPAVGLGAIAVFARETQNMYIGSEPWGKAKNTYLTFMPAAKFNWLRKQYFGMYSKVAAGVTLRTQKEDYPEGRQEDLSKSKLLFNFHVTGLGFEAGPEVFRGFIELGIGEQGMLNAGLRAKF